MKNEFVLQPDQAFTLKSVMSWLAAFLGIGTFLGFVNLAVGLLSAAWLLVQLYGYIRHELPMKRMRKQLLRRELEANATCPAPLDGSGK
ncbi:hypothetical protein [Comamonas fluminis]|uniref:hypothetical protein n=1 Tax=Comamonas fluminis TaxID=2796366 RepID=UPI001C493AA4|nr:hypothetical protein [Comamonas fluminis]